MKNAIAGRLKASAPFLFFVSLSVAALLTGGDRVPATNRASLSAADPVLAFTAPERRLF